MSFVAGPYAWTLGSAGGPVGSVVPLGITEDAPNLEIATQGDPIIGDNLGGSMQDGVFRGGDCYFDAVLQEYDAALTAKALYPYAAEFGAVGCVGALLSNYADELIGTPLNPTCTTTGTNLFTGFKAVLALNFPIRLLMGSRLRNVPIRFQLLPYDDAGTTRWFKFADAP